MDQEKRLEVKQYPVLKLLKRIERKEVIEQGRTGMITDTVKKNTNRLVIPLLFRRV